LRVYIPRHFRLDDPAEVLALVASAGSADLVTAGPEGVPVATLLPVVWQPERDRVIAHMARANPHWKLIEGDTPALAIVNAAQAYVSPAWYAAKVEHGRVVPTWNYSAVHLTGTVRVHDDVDWVRDAVTLLTGVHESARQPGWAVTDAPERYIEGQLRGIVGIELTVTGVEAKAKLSQNRSDADRAGVVAGLRAEPGGDGVATAMEAVGNQRARTVAP
jgi:transcriptional regulator